MLVAAGLEHKTTAEIADAYEAAFHADAALLNLLPGARLPARDRAHPRDGRARRATRRRGPCLRQRGRATSTTRRVLPGLRRPVREHARRAAGGSSRRGRARQARPGRLRALEGGRRGPDAEVADPALGRGLPGLAPRVLGDGAAAISGRGSTSTRGGIDNVFPHHEDEIAQSAPIVGGPPARDLGPRRVPPGRRAGRWRSPRATSSGSPTSRRAGIDPLAFRYLCLTSRYRHKLEYTDESLAAAAAGLASLRAALAALGPAPADGPWAAPPVASGRRGAGSARSGPPTGSRATATAAGPRSGGPRPRARALPCRRPGARSTSGSSRRSTTTSTCRRPSRSSARRSGRTCRPTSGAGSSSTPTSCSGSIWIAPSTAAGRSLPRRRSLPADVAALADERAAARADARLRPVRRHPRASWPSSATRSTTDRTARPSGAADQPVARSRRAPEPVDDPVEVPLAQAVALGLGQRRPAAVLVADRRDRRRRRLAAGRLPSPSSRRTRLHQMSRLR